MVLSDTIRRTIWEYDRYDLLWKDLPNWHPAHLTHLHQMKKLVISFNRETLKYEINVEEIEG